MKRLGLAVLAVVSGTMGAWAQDPEPQPALLRVRLEVSEEVVEVSDPDTNTQQINTFQYYLFRNLHQFGIRVDSANRIGHSQLDGWVDRQEARWAERDPSTAPASLVLQGNSHATYDMSEFFGQGQAHNYAGTAELRVLTPAGDPVATFQISHDWGRLPARFTQQETLREYNDQVFTALLLAVLHLDEVRAGVPEDKQDDLEAFIERERERILRPLRESEAEYELVDFLEALGADDE